MSDKTEPSALSKLLAQIKGLLGEAKTWLILLVSVALLLSIAATISARAFGWNIPMVATLDPYNLALICAGFWAVSR